MKKLFAAVALLTAIGAVVPGAGVAFAQDASSSPDVASFYRGKQMRIIVRSGPGGGFDLYSRLLARHIVKHIPGNPMMVAQNMPAGGGIAAVSYVVGPGVPLDRAQALRKAFDDTLVDPDFVAEAKKSGMEIGPMDGATVQRLIEDVQSAPVELRTKLRTLMPPR